MAQRVDIRNEAVDLLQKALQPQYIGWDDQYRAVVSVLMGQPHFLSRMLEEALYEKDHYDALDLCEKDAIEEMDTFRMSSSFRRKVVEIVEPEYWYLEDPSDRFQLESFFDAMMIVWWGMGTQAVDQFWADVDLAEG